MSENDSNKIQTYIFEEINTKEELNKVEEEEKLFEMNKKMVKKIMILIMLIRIIKI